MSGLRALSYFFCLFFLSLFMAKVNAQTPLQKIGESYYLEIASEAERFIISDLTGDNFKIQICNLEVGESYFLSTGLNYSTAALPVINSQNVNWSEVGRVIRFEPEESCIQFGFSAKRESIHQFPVFSISKEVQRVEEQRTASRTEGIRIVADNNAEDLIKDVLVGGNCFDISNVRGIGPDFGMGRFYNGSSSIGIEEGIVFSTGYVSNIVGPNSSNMTGRNMGGVGDPDLELLVDGQAVYDAVGIQFDFVPTSDTVRFRYVFASEEYCEWVNANYNDVFGFFISGPGLSGPFTNNGVNIATIPGTEEFVAIGNVNHNVNSHLFFDNTPQGQDQGSGSVSSCGNLLDRDGVAVELIEFDGFTAVFEATAVVVPCENYTIKMVIGDVFDLVYDSGVFLEANSFNAGASALMESRVVGFSDNLIFDECLADMGYFVLKRLGSSNLSQAVEVNLSFSNMSTAIPGLDFEPLPGTIVIPAGEDSVLVPLRILDTYSGERLSIVYELEDLCSCTSPFAEIIIDFNPNQPKAEIASDGILTCESQSVELIGTILTPELVTNYLWLDANGVIIAENELQITTFSGGNYAFVVLNENSSCTDTITFFVESDTDLPTIDMETPEIINCNNETISLSATSSVIGPEISFYWEALGNGQIIGNSDAPIIDVATAGIYQLTVRNEFSGCESRASVEVYSDFELPLAELDTPEELNCDRRETTIDVFSDFSFSELHLSWSTLSGSIESDPTSNSIVVSEAGFYQLEITLIRNGCSIELSAEVSENISTPMVYLGEDLVFPCSLETLVLRAEILSEGSDFELNWSGTAEITEIASDEVIISEAGVYTLRILDLSNGCRGEDEIVVSRNLPVAIHMDVFQPVCPGDAGLLSVLSIDGGTYPFTYLLSGGRYQNLESNGFFNQLKVGEYQVEVIDALGCSLTTGFEILEPKELEVFLPERDIAKLGNPYEMPLDLNVGDDEIAYVWWTGDAGIDCPDCLRPIVYLMRPGTLEVYIEDYRGCFAEGEIYLDLDKRPSVFIPNAFSPNNDGVNEFFTLYSDQSVERIVELNIYNRWGKRYYQRLDFLPNDNQIGWDGTDYRGRKAEPGVYIYTAIIELINGDIIELSGEVQVFR